MNCDKREEEIPISITIGNSSDWNIILTGKTYYFTVKRNIKVIDLLELFYKNFEGEALSEIKRYSLFTKKMIKLNNDDSIDVSFSNINDSYLDIIDKDESMFFVLTF